jgi:hypothetical protein
VRALRVTARATGSAVLRLDRRCVHGAGGCRPLGIGCASERLSPHPHRARPAQSSSRSSAQPNRDRGRPRVGGGLSDVLWSGSSAGRAGCVCELRQRMVGGPVCRRGTDAHPLGCCRRGLDDLFAAAGWVLRHRPAARALSGWSDRRLLGGLCAAWRAGLRHRWAPLAQPAQQAPRSWRAVLASSFLAEGLWSYLHELQYDATAALWITIGASIAILSARGRLTELRWIAVTLPIGLIGEIALTTIYRQSF